MIDNDEYKDYVCVDGLQRITAAMYLNVNDLKTEKEVMQWYVDMNSGGTPHTNDKIEKVKKMIREFG